MNVSQSIPLIVGKIVHRILQWPSKITHQVYSISPIKKRREHSRARLIRAHNPNLSPLTTEETFLAQALKQRGFCRTHLDLFEAFGSDQFRAAADDLYDVMERTYRETGRTIDIIKVLAAKPSLLDQFQAVFRAGLDPKLLKIVEHYLQLPVAYGGVDIFFTVADGLERGARTWHKDSEDNPMVKVAVYLNDVGDNDGPLEILHLQHTTPAVEKSRGFRQQNLVDLQNEGKLTYDITSFTGPAGTVVLCDTFKYFHRGKLVTGQNRKALFFNYYAYRPLTPYFCPNPPFALDRMKDLVSHLSAPQKNAALWRESLPWIDKVVTKTKPYLNI